MAVRADREGPGQPRRADCSWEKFKGKERKGKKKILHLTDVFGVLMSVEFRRNRVKKKKGNVWPLFSFAISRAAISQEWLQMCVFGH